MAGAGEGNKGEIVIYRAEDGAAALEVRLEGETVWLDAHQMAQLFGKNTDTIGLHIRNAFREGELDETSTTEESSVVQAEGGRQVRRTVRFYNLDVIIDFVSRGNEGFLVARIAKQRSITGRGVRRWQA